MITQKISYLDQNVSLEGFVASPKEKKKFPCVLLCHAWRGKDDFICEKAKLMAEWGYTGFALDMYGKGVLGNSKEENAKLKAPFLEDRAYLLRRAMLGYDTACSLPHVDESKIVTLGFGFGGVCALDLARSALPLKGAISVYGHFDPPKQFVNKAISAKILVFHGYNDPIVTMDELNSFEKEMTEREADWQAHLFSQTVHAFANPLANDVSSGILYHPRSEERTWKYIRVFLQEIFGY